MDKNMILKDEQTRHCRDEHIDLIKGFAIILVVFGHAIQYLLGEAMDNSIVFRVIYSFHMPLFIWVSGYTYGLYSEKFDLIWLWKRFKGFIIPFWMWAIIMWGLREAANGTVSLKERLFGLLSDPSNNGLWFLVTAFYCCLILSIAWQSASLIVKTGIAIKLKRSEDQKQSRTHLQKLFLIILIFLVIVISELDRRSLIHMPYRVSRWYIHFFMFGFYFAILKRTANGETDNSISEVSTLVGTKIMRKAFMIIVFCIMYTGMMSHWTRSMTIDTVMPRLGSEWFGPILYQLFRYMVPICAIIIIYEVLQFPLWKKTLLIRTALVTAGKSSLPIYAMQWFFLGNSLGGYYETLIIRTLTATVMPWYLGKYVLQRFAITNQLLLGGRRG